MEWVLQCNPRAYNGQRVLVPCPTCRSVNDIFYVSVGDNNIVGISFIHEPLF